MGKIKKGSLLRNITGKVGDITVGKYRNPNTGKTTQTANVREGIDGNRIKTGAEFVNTRAVMSEFGTASSIGSALKQGLNPLLGKAAIDRGFYARLQGTIHKALHNDSVNMTGERVLNFADAGALQGLEINPKLRFATAVKKDMILANGAEDIVVTVPELIPFYDVVNQDAATHCEIAFVACKIDEDGTITWSPVVTSGYFDPMATAAVATQDLTLTGVMGGAGYVVFASYRTYKESAGFKIPLNNKAFNCAVVLAVGAGA